MKRDTGFHKLSERELAKLSPEDLATLKAAQQRELEGLEVKLKNYDWDAQCRSPIVPDSSQNPKNKG